MVDLRDRCLSRSQNKIGSAVAQEIQYLSIPISCISLCSENAAYFKPPRSIKNPDFLLIPKPHSQNPPTNSRILGFNRRSSRPTLALVTQGVLHSRERGEDRRRWYYLISVLLDILLFLLKSRTTQFSFNFTSSRPWSCVVAWSRASLIIKAHQQVMVDVFYRLLLQNLSSIPSKQDLATRLLWVQETLIFSRIIAAI